MRDLIDKRELQDEFAKECRGDCGICPHEVWGTCNLINMMPTVEAKEVVHAKWIDGCCSNCGAYVPTDSRMDFIDENDCKFCYSCGAYMRTSAE